jgi:membrane protein DedA with SNARE-associated domain
MALGDEGGVTVAGLADLAAAASTFEQFVTLFALPFGHEDVAIIWGSYVISQGYASPTVVFCGLYAGIFASDLAVFGIGVGARHVEWLRRFGMDRRVAAVEDRVKANFFVLMVLCRIVPGLLFPAFVACGWSGVGIVRFAASSLLLTAVQLPVLLGVTLLFGTAASELSGAWAWVAIGFLMAGIAVGRRGLAHLGTVLTGSTVVSLAHVHGQANQTEREIDPATQVSLAERLPAVVFYAPLVANWLRLAVRYRSLTLPTTVNHCIPTGGMWGESKSLCLQEIQREHRPFVATSVSVLRGETGMLASTLGKALDGLAEGGIEFPLVAKPDVGWHGFGVRVLSNPEDLAAYLQIGRPCTRIILQELVPYDGEAAVLYAREPGQDRGRILSLTLRHYPRVIGDGRSSVEELIRSTPRSRWKSSVHLGCDPLHAGLKAADLKRVPASGEIIRLAFIASDRVGGSYRDLSREITCELERRVNSIARSMPEFHYGRFDFRFRSLEELRRGRGFKIIEVNGIGSEAIEVWDPEHRISEAYRTLFAQQALLFQFGARNRERGHEPMPLAAFLGAARQQTKLIRSYPRSE